MVGFGVGHGHGEEGSRRRLPSWMVTVVDNDDDDGRIAIQPKQNSQLKSETNTSNNITCRRTKSSQVDEKKRKVGKKKEIHQDHDDDNDGELTLTVQDLLTIAKEYVQADRDSDIPELRSSSNKDKDFQSESSSNDFSRVSNNKTIPKSPNASATSITSLASTSGDDPNPAHHHMLHLFLGPWLDKPPSRNRQS